MINRNESRLIARERRNQTENKRRGTGSQGRRRTTRSPSGVKTSAA